MRYTLKRKIVSIGGDSMIKDAQGQDVYLVDGAAISIGRRLAIKDMQGRELATIHQKPIALRPTFDISINNGTNAKVTKKMLSLRDQLKIAVDGSSDLEAHGNFLHHEYDIARSGREVAHVTKKYIALTDSYTIDIDDDQDQVLLLACAVVIDEILESREHKIDLD